MIDWKKADWTKSNQEIADELDCNYLTVHNKRKALGLPKGPRTIPRAPVLISEPIDYELLAQCFVKARWRWYINDEIQNGFPSAERIKRSIEQKCADLEPAGNLYKRCSSGGITVERREDGLTVLLDYRLAKYYVPKIEQKQTEEPKE